MLIDREKVINGLRFTSAMLLFNPLTGAEKDPSDLNEDDRATYDACVGAIELLQEQEPVKPRVAHVGSGSCHLAPVSHKQIGGAIEHDNYCSECGRKVDWGE